MYLCIDFHYYNVHKMGKIIAFEKLGTSHQQPCFPYERIVFLTAQPFNIFFCFDDPSLLYFSRFDDARVGYFSRFDDF